RRNAERLRQPARAVLEAKGVEVPEGGGLYAWMLDPKVVLEGVVDRFAPSEEDAGRIRKSRLYQALGEVITGLQEYTAAEALYAFEQEGRYDLIILDTPPSRNALDFLDAPRRLARFLDERTLSIFAPDPNKKMGAVLRAASSLVSNALSRTFGASFAEELRSFLGAFGKLFDKMRVHADGVRTLLRSSRSAFLVVASPDEAALSEAVYFKGRIKDLGLQTEGFILNRSYASDQTMEHPSALSDRLGESASAELHGGLGKMDEMAEIEKHRIAQDRELLAKLVREGHETGQGALALPFLDEVVEDIPALRVLSDYILAAS
ncbi:MAG: ArsA-related P-loop ATPase, partial [Myxococcota bacterium]